MRHFTTKLALLVLGWGFLAALCVLATQPVKFPGDEWALAELAGLRVGWLDAAAVAVTALGNAGIGVVVPVPWIPMLAVAAMWMSNRRADAVFLAAASLAPAINLSLKEVIARARPDAYLAVVEESGYAFPSGHAAFAAAFLGALVVVAGRTNPLNEHAALRRAIQGALLLLCIAVAASRVYLGVHWPSDVIAGLLFGGLYMATLAFLESRLSCRMRRKLYLRSNG